MRKFLFFCLVGLMLIPSVAAERKKVGLVLGGGGAKGVAHIGVLKVLEEAGIPIDYIAGTSMGAIVGGLYSVGYSAHEIDSLVRAQDWDMLLSDRVKRSSLTFPEKENAERYIFSIPFGGIKDVQISGMIKGRNLQNLFSNLTVGYHDSVDFNQLKIPFACVAIDVVNGREQVFRSGSLPTAMRASMAIPAVFAPVYLDSMVLVDGGIKNNYPVDVVRKMGADLIIGVDLGTSDLKMLERLNAPWDVIGQIVALNGYDKYNENKDHTDLLLRPNTSPYTSASFTKPALDSLIVRGEHIARKQWDMIMELKQQIGIPDSIETTVPASPLSRPLAETDTFLVRNIYLEGVDPKDERWLTQISGLKENSPITVKKLKEAMSIIVGTNVYSSASYKLRGEEQADLILTVQPKSMSAVNFGVNFNTEEIVALLLNANVDLPGRIHSKLGITGRIGKRTYGRLDYAVAQNPLRNFNFAYMFAYNDLNVYERGEKTMSTTYRHHFLEFGYSDMKWLNFKLKVGARYEYFDYNSFLYTGEDQKYQVVPEGFISYFAQAHLETLDRSNFPNQGVSLKADYSIYTDNFVTYKGHPFFSALSADFLAVLPLTSHLSLLPSLSGRVLIGQDIAYPFLNVVGGDVPGKYLPQQLAFAGINHFEIFNNAVVIARMNLRQRIAQRHYISLIANYGIHHDNFFDIFSGKSVWGGSLGYAYNSVFGPISTNFGLSNRNQKAQFYLNIGYNF